MEHVYFIDLPFEQSDSRQIIYPDPSKISEFAINSPMLKAKNRKLFDETVSRYWNSVGSFSEEEISFFQAEALLTSDDNVARFVKLLLLNGLPLQILINNIFKVVVKSSSSIGLLFFDCTRLAVSDDGNSEFLKICYCSPSALKSAESNINFIMSSFGVEVYFRFLYYKHNP